MGQAQKVVEGYGVDVEGFNMMLARADRDPFRAGASGGCPQGPGQGQRRRKGKSQGREGAEKMSRFFASSETN